MNDRHIDMICFDRRNFARGEMLGLFKNGCEMITQERPQFPLKSKLYLNFFNEISKKAITLEARLSKYELRDHKWVCQMRWDLLDEKTESLLCASLQG